MLASFIFLSQFLANKESLFKSYIQLFLSVFFSSVTLYFDQKLVIVPLICFIQIIFSGMDKESWENSTNGLTSRDIAMNVALPEVDGRILARAVAFKDSAKRDPISQVNIVKYKPQPNRIDFTCKLLSSWIEIRNTARKELICCD